MQKVCEVIYHQWDRRRSPGHLILPAEWPIGLNPRTSTFFWGDLEEPQKGGGTPLIKA